MAERDTRSHSPTQVSTRPGQFNSISLNRSSWKVKPSRVIIGVKNTISMLFAAQIVLSLHMLNMFSMFFGSCMHSRFLHRFLSSLDLLCNSSFSSLLPTHLTWLLIRRRSVRYLNFHFHGFSNFITLKIH